MTADNKKLKNDVVYILSASELKNVHVKDYEKVALMLSKMAQKNPPWGWRYVESVLRGTVNPGRKFLATLVKLISDLRKKKFHVKHISDMSPKELLWCLQNRTEMK